MPLHTRHQTFYEGQKHINIRAQKIMNLRAQNLYEPETPQKM